MTFIFFSKREATFEAQIKMLLCEMYIHKVDDHTSELHVC